MMGPSERDHVRTSDVQLAVVIPFCVRKLSITSENVSATGDNSIYGKVKLFKGTITALVGKCLLTFVTSL